MVKMNSNYNEMSCTNCKKNNSNMNDEKNSQDINKKDLQKNGLIVSIISIILFILFFVPYVCFFVIGPIIEYGFAFGSGVSILGGAFVGFFISFPTLVSIILGIISIDMYKKRAQKRSAFRKILNILNIISLITIIVTIIFFFILILFL